MRKLLSILLCFVMCLGFVGCGGNKEPTMSDAKEILSPYYMDNDDGSIYAWIRISTNGVNEEHSYIFDELEEKFGTPSFDEIKQICKDLKYYNIKNAKTTKKGNVEIVISPIPTKDSSLMVSITVKGID